jgi:hypothetical protein
VNESTNDIFIDSRSFLKNGYGFKAPIPPLFSVPPTLLSCFRKGQPRAWAIGIVVLAYSIYYR